MNELAANTSPLFNYGVLAIIILVAFIVWFFVNRASVRASEQIRLLEAVIEEQKKQNALLRRLVDAQSSTAKPPADEDADEKRDFIRMIPER
ncbi:MULTISPECIES: YebO family protein [unclassified Pantoea]|uniref:YebO family protein n=1 Tax=unclassified Pantoea TaxID=2630326 RepID=UPI0024531028|nr:MULTISPECIES: YebO family protein [unclassified Pantoea]MDR6350212.1 putative membrane protein [Pantoea sp. SORGH_AS_0659]WGK55646.1 YebO family protein [Pantoea sp. SS70]